MADGRGVPRRLTKETVGRGIAKSGVREYPEDVEEPKESRREERREDRGDDE